MGLIVHHLGHSQSDRVVWLCEELGIKYELNKYDRSPVLSPQEYKDLHPIGAAPVIEDDGGVKKAETEACVEWICNKHANGKLLVKPSETNYADYLYWYHVTNGTLQPAVGRVMALKMSGIKEEDATLQRYTAKIHQVLKYVEERLSQTPWLAGDEFSAADIMIIFTLTTMREFCPVDLSAYNNILAYVQKIIARPAYKSYLQKGDPDNDIQKYAQGPPPPMFAAFANHK
ncbi:Glutathione S-transferase 3 [Fulvia fulva]|uniref:Glutathione S-transferase 3 n=1 Tax=Passalora fulva TaxID=5499 RepID=A0A9Q8LEJ5_PASFU|nr:Glutathione S-transferase 3 [Fulvia fulva]KAK4628204.1 Glutathione S-transferase 3 [Fulvia fulva]UJO15963.1 Glutathione S-transferase 3 [Fulvia fulva]WPV28339.1 Glutathione S-transferase 3 [Fulvia fulva]